MHIHFLDPYRPVDSPLHRLDARVKLVLALGFIMAVALAPIGRWPAYILFLTLALSAAVLSRLGAGFAARRALLALPFALAALPLAFSTPGAPLAEVHVGMWSLRVTGAGVERLASIVLKSWLSVQAGTLLAATTPFPDLLMAMRAIYIPRLLVAIFGLMWRYLFVLADEALRLTRARDARSGSLDGAARSSVFWRARVTGHMAGNLFLRGYERSERIYHAMLARGYDGEIRTLPVPPLQRRDGLILGAGLTLFVLLLILL